MNQQITRRAKRAGLLFLFRFNAKEETPMDSFIDSLFDQYERGGMTRPVT
jgi:hypothetical protein